LLGAILETVGELGLAAVAGNVAGLAAQILGGNGEHVGDAFFTAGIDGVWDGLSRDQGDDAGEESE